MTGVNISALVVAHNEEEQLPDCLRSLAFADEIVVVLDKCTDRSRDIADQFTQHILEGSWDVEGERRNTGIDACHGDWVLEVDADERVSEDLAAELRTIIVNSDPGYYLIPFNNYIGQRLVRYGWGAYIGTGSKPCLFSRGSKRWGLQTIHPEITLPQYRGRLQHAMIHRIDDDIPDLIRRFNRYCETMAADPHHAGKAGGFFRNLVRFPGRFFKCYIRKQGFREGFYGFLIALLAGLMPITIYFKSRRLHPPA